jgi:hypothetical protein
MIADLTAGALEAWKHVLQRLRLRRLGRKMSSFSPQSEEDAMHRFLLLPAATIVLLLSSGCGSPSLASRLPANNEIDTWLLDGSPTVVDTDTKLYNQIDGAAPKYIDRGWVGSAYASYRRDTDKDSVQVAIHDMGNSDNAQSLYNFDLPVSRVQIASPPDAAVVDMGLPSAYRAEAYAGNYYIEISIDDHSDAALEYAKRFTLAILKRCQ